MQSQVLHVPFLKHQDQSFDFLSWDFDTLGFPKEILAYEKNLVQIEEILLHNEFLEKSCISHIKLLENDV